MSAKAQFVLLRNKAVRVRVRVKTLQDSKNPLKTQRFQGIKLVREAGLEPARPEWTLEPESSESANSTTRASFVKA